MASWSALSFPLTSITISKVLVRRDGAKEAYREKKREKKVITLAPIWRERDLRSGSGSNVVTTAPVLERREVTSRPINPEYGNNRLAESNTLAKHRNFFAQSRVGVMDQMQSCFEGGKVNGISGMDTSGNLENEGGKCIEKYTRHCAVWGG